MQKILTSFAVLAVILHYGTAYSKYGRTCKDIGCLSSEVCTMAEDPCSYYNRDQCGSYPTCKSNGQNAAPSCTNFVCPPTQVCRLDNNTPKCVTGSSSNGATSTRVEQNQNSQSLPDGVIPSYPNQPSAPVYPGSSYPAQPSYPGAPNYPQGGGGNGGGGLYPQLPGSQTTPRPAQMNPNYPNGGGYRGGAVGSGYPGQTQGGYPGQAGGYPSHGGGYPSQGGGYPSQGGGYPSQGSGSYPGQGGGGYPGYGGQQYPGYQGQGNRYPNGQGQYGGNRNRYGNAHSGTTSNPLVDKLTNQLKTIGLFCVIVKFVVARMLTI